MTGYVGQMLSKIIILVGYTSLVACGQSTPFAGGTKKKNKPNPAAEAPADEAQEEDTTTGSDDLDASAEPVPTGPEITAVAMNLKCQEQGEQAALGLAEVPTLAGEGDEALVKSWNNGSSIPLLVAGELCQPEAVSRQIVISVDVSGSMAANDPIVSGSCERLRAVEALMASGGPSKSYAIVTFSDAVVDSSTGFYDDPKELFASIDPNASRADILCNALGSTFYDLALDRGLTLYQEAAYAPFRELYFVSDGAPSATHEGLGQAQLLRDAGVTIGAIMLDGVDQVLESDIVSLGPDGRPLFRRVDEADALTQTLEDLAAAAENRVLAARFLKKAISTGQVEELNVLDYAKGSAFSLPALSIAPDLEAIGYELLFWYRKAGGDEVSMQSRILWH